MCALRDTFMIFPPKQAPFLAATVVQALGFALVDWPSGRRTLEQYASSVVVSDLELAMARNDDSILRAKTANLIDSMAEFQLSHAQHGYFIRTKKRPKARKVTAVTWVHPNTYDGPIPDAHGVLPNAR